MQILIHFSNLDILSIPWPSQELLFQSLLPQFIRKLKQRVCGKEYVNKRSPVKAHHIPVFVRKNKELQKATLNPCVFFLFCIITHSAPRFSVISKWHKSKKQLPIALLVHHCLSLLLLAYRNSRRYSDVCFLSSCMVTTPMLSLKLNSCRLHCYATHYPLALETFLDCFWPKGVFWWRYCSTRITVECISSSPCNILSPFPPSPSHILKDCERDERICNIWVLGFFANSPLSTPKKPMSLSHCKLPLKFLLWEKAQLSQWQYRLFHCQDNGFLHFD